MEPPKLGFCYNFWWEQIILKNSYYHNKEMGPKKINKIRETRKKEAKTNKYDKLGGMYINSPSLNSL